MTVGVVEWLVVTPHLLLAAGGAAVTAWAWLASLRAPGPAAPDNPLDVDELAYLAGGPRRVVEVAVARLVRSGELEVRPGARVRVRGSGGGPPGSGGGPAAGEGTAAGSPDGVSSPAVLDRRVLFHAVRDGSVARILAAHAGDPEVVAARDRLAVAGLVGDSAAAGLRRRARHTLVTLAELSVAAGVLVFAGLLIGIARTGASPVWFGVLGVAVTVTAGLTILVWVVDPRPMPRFRTAAGLRALARARRAPDRGTARDGVANRRGGSGRARDRGGSDRSQGFDGRVANLRGAPDRATDRRGAPDRSRVSGRLPESSRDRRVALAGLSAEVPLGWRGTWWRVRHVLVRLVPVVAIAVVVVATAEVLVLVARLS